MSGSRQSLERKSASPKERRHSSSDTWFQKPAWCLRKRSIRPAAGAASRKGHGAVAALGGVGKSELQLHLADLVFVIFLWIGAEHCLDTRDQARAIQPDFRISRIETQQHQ